MEDEYKNAWHHVRGVTPEELRQAAREAERLYGDIIDLPRPVSKRHPPLSMEQKAAQFSPFAALNGFEEAVDETTKAVRETMEKNQGRKEKP